MSKKLCTICGKPIILIPSAKERAKKSGKTPQYYVNLFTAHSQCVIDKRNQDAIKLIRSINNG